MAIITNEQIALLGIGTTFQGQTAEMTKDILLNTGYEGYQGLDNNAKSQFWNLIYQAYLLKIRGPQVKIPKSFERVVDFGSNPYGGQAREIRTKLQKSTNPRGLNIVKGASVDPFVYRPIEVEEKYWKVNWEYANNSTIDDKQLPLSFSSETGISEVISKVMKNLDDAKALQEWTMIQYIFNTVINRAGIYSVEVPKVDAQSTNAVMGQWIEIFHNFYDSLKESPYSAEFNEAKFEHGVDMSNYVLYIRSTIWNHIKTTLLATTYHTENLGLPFTVIPVKNFAGITYKDGNTPVVPVYSSNAADAGTVLGYNADGDESKPYKQPHELTPVDNNETLDAVLVEKGAIFIRDNSPYKVDAIYNPAGDYTNFWAKQHNRTIGYDDSYDIIKFVHSNA